MTARMLTAREVAARLQLGRATACRHVKQGILPQPVRLGRAVRFPLEPIERIERGELPQPAEPQAMPDAC